jgi:diguanylate cyclase (GGDEF)-like protein
MLESSPGRWKTVLLGHDRRQRISIAMTLPAVAVYAVSCVAQWVWARQGYASESAAAMLILVIAACQLLLYVALRSGWTLTFQDPALTLQQMVLAILCLGAGYAINHQVRGTLLMVVPLVLVFGAFKLAPDQCRMLGWLAFSVLGIVMIAGTTLDPVQFPPTIEFLNFVFIAITLPLVGQLTGRLSQMRFNLHGQKKELRVALEAVKSLATRDQLTGLPNRRHVLETIEAWRSSSCLHRPAPLCIAVIDLDHFKAINDRFGHPFGDKVLTNFSRAALAVIPEGDILARWGGEEFVLLMPGTPLAAALEKLEILHAHLRDPVNWRGCAHGQVKFSAGLAAYRIEESFEQTLTRADRGLYEAKRQGRDRSVCV